MGAHLKRPIAFGQLQISVNELNTCMQVWNFASGYHSKIEFDAQEFGRFQDFGQTLEQLFFLFAHQNDCRIIGFESSTNTLFECIQDANNAELWSREELPVNLNVTQTERKTPGSWTLDDNVDNDSIFGNEKQLFLASNLFKTYLVRNDSTTVSSTIQRVFESKKPSVIMPIYSINQTIKKVCAGNDFVLLLTNAGHVYSLGTGTRGELGVLPMIAQSNEPRPVEDLMDAEIHVSDIACGGWHTLALTSEQDVYAWGLNADGQCGVPVEEANFLEIPHPINLDQAALQIRAGPKSTFVRLEDDSTVVYGRGT